MDITYSSDEELAKWFKRFENAPEYVNYIKGIPFSYREVRNEIYRRENVRKADDDLKAFFSQDESPN